MGSLSDSSDVGARLISDQHYYSGRRVGPGRWARLDGVGILWTDDDDALGLSRLDDADQDAAYVLIKRLHAMAGQNVPATQTFDRIVAERDVEVISTGDLPELFGITE